MTQEVRLLNLAFIGFGHVGIEFARLLISRCTWLRKALGVETPLAGYETPLMGLEECFKLMCGSVAGIVSKVTDAEGLLAAVLGLGIDEIYGKLCQKLWDTMAGKGAEGKKIP